MRNIIYSSFEIFSLWVWLCRKFQTHESRLKQNDILFHPLFILIPPLSKEIFNLNNKFHFVQKNLRLEFTRKSSLLDIWDFHCSRMLRLGFWCATHWIRRFISGTWSAAKRSFAAFVTNFPYHIEIVRKWVVVFGRSWCLRGVFEASNTIDAMRQW